MTRLGVALMLFAALTLCLQGCGDKEKGDAKVKWAAFQSGEVAKIQAAFDKVEMKPYDFQERILEVEDLPYRFKGIISFKRGSVYQEHSYAFVDGSWAPVKHVDPKDAKAAKEKREKIEGIEAEISRLTSEIEKDEEALKALQERLELLEANKAELETLQAELEELKADL